MTPYLSIVMGIGGNMSDDLLKRLQFSTNNNLAYAAQSELSCELIIVEWNVSLRNIGTVESVISKCDRRGIPVRIIHADRKSVV